ncbi:MAG: hypothetical protein ACYC9O_11280 [Candidatus Latescibacterota bacterium]
MMKDPDISAAIEPIAGAFEKLGIRYYIGGSVASSIYGTARSTLDVDMISDLQPHHVRLLVDMLQESYYIDEGAILEATRRHSSFNLIHFKTMIKVDVFILGSKPYSLEALSRRRKDKLEEDPRAVEFFLSSPEDSILMKLDWYRLGGEVSERQWNDVLGVLKVQDKNLDRGYLQHWASELKLSDLLERAFREAGIPE